MTSELKPCPFCGGTDLSSGGDDKVVGYHCRTCQASGPNHYGSHEWNTRAVPDVPELVRYDPNNKTYPYFEMEESELGDYVRYNQAAKIIAAKTATNMIANSRVSALEKSLHLAEAKLAQIEATLKDSNAVHIAMLRGDIAKPTPEQINHIYTSPAPAADPKIND